MAFYINGNTVAYSDSFRVEKVPRKIKTFIGNKNIIKCI